MDKSIVGRVRRITFKTVAQAMAANEKAKDPERTSRSTEPVSLPFPPRRREKSDRKNSRPIKGQTSRTFLRLPCRPMHNLNSNFF